MRIDLHTRFDDVAAPAWQAVLDSTADCTVFQQRAWLKAWWDTQRQPGWALHLLAVRDGSELVGLAPLYERAGRFGGRELRLLGEGQSDYLTFAVHRDFPQALDNLLAALAARIDDGCNAVLLDIPEGSLLQQALQQHIARQVGEPQLALHATQRTPCPRVSLDADGAALAAVLRKQSLRRHARALAAVGPLDVAHHDSAAGILPLLPQFFALHIDRWQDSATPSQFIHRACRQLYETAVRTLPAGTVWLTTVHAGARLAAVHLGLRHHQTLIWYIPAHDRALRRHGPGEVLLQAVLQQAQAQGLRQLDLARGDEPYKRRFADHTGWTSSYEWISDHWLARGRQRLRLAARRLRG